ncbi:MAG: hypothetical protein OXT67_05130, partial [Zetaproteobacteria bacterium]|nr:hypothetical protein [Zetaproteobacteria bacterium]
MNSKKETEAVPQPEEILTSEVGVESTVTAERDPLGKSSIPEDSNGGEKPTHLLCTIDEMLQSLG